MIRVSYNESRNCNQETTIFDDHTGEISLKTLNYTPSLCYQLDLNLTHGYERLDLTLEREVVRTDIAVLGLGRDGIQPIQLQVIVLLRLDVVGVEDGGAVLGPLVDDGLALQGQEEAEAVAVPLGEEHLRQHYARLVGLVGDSGVPEARVADDHGALWQGGSDRGHAGGARVQQDLLDVWLVGRDVVGDASVVVRAQPHLGGAVVDRRLDQARVQRVAVRESREGEVHVGVYALALRAAETDVGAQEAAFGRRSQEVLQYLQRPGVGVHILEEELLVQRRREGDVARFAALDVPQRVFAPQVLGIGAHLRVDGIFMCDVDSIAERDDAVPVHGFDHLEKAVVRELFGRSLLVGDLDNCDRGAWFGTHVE